LRSNGHGVIFHNLYEEKFDPILPHSEAPKESPLDTVIRQHCSELAKADGIIIIHPNWWGQPPAIEETINRFFPAVNDTRNGSEH